MTHMKTIALNLVCWLCLILCPQLVLGQQAGAGAARDFSANGSRNFGETQVNLEDQLRVSLRTVNSKQVAFVKVVVNLVNQKRLPRQMINLVMRWAKEKNAKIPFPYFQFAMRELAKRRGVIIP